MVQRVGSSHGIPDRLDVFTQLDLSVPLKNSSVLGLVANGIMHLRGIRAGLAQNLRVFLCTDLGIMRGFLLVVFAAGRLGCWCAGLLVGFAAGKLAVNTTTFILNYMISFIYNQSCAINKNTCADTCAHLRTPAFWRKA